uniref:Uncharacterized protein n=1 Tax=Arcella intermedia TaxID=1963864 RepID=A0A6B2LYW9_9EUKA
MKHKTMRKGHHYILQVEMDILQLLRYFFLTKQILKHNKMINGHHYIMQVKMVIYQLLRFY